MTELEKALRLIRDECKSRTVCKECPLRDGNNGKCYFSNGQNPEEWRLVGDDSDNRLFV